MEANTDKPTKEAVRVSCRNCGQGLEHVFLDLGVSPLCESYVSEAGLREAETFYPLCAYVCGNCFLVQVQDFETPEHIFREYAYFSSFSQSWLEHAKTYSDMMIERFKLNENSFVVEIASNDGYLLQNFVRQDIPVLGIDPARNIAEAAREKGVDTLAEFFGQALAKGLAKERQADLIAANNVLAHVPDINDFVAGFSELLKPEGVATFEFPHLLTLIQERQFDTIYHEHFSYLSLFALEPIFARHGLRVFDIETLSTHGGSLRLFVAHDSAAHTETNKVNDLREHEKAGGLDSLDTYLGFEAEVRDLKHNLLRLLLDLKAQGKTAAGYGAPGKGNTLLNYCGIYPDLLSYTVDLNPYKHHKYLPGTHIPIYPPDKLAETRPDYIMLLPWNLKDELLKQLDYARDWGAKFIVAVPEPQILD